MTTYTMIGRGSYGDDVQEWQRRLGILQDGSFGPATEEATKKWQEAHGLKPDGVVGQSTWEASRSSAPPPTVFAPSGTYAFVPAAHFTKGPRRCPVDLVVIHTMESPETHKTAENVSAWFAGKDAPQASAHYCVDDDSVVQCVHEDDIAWHAPGANNNGIGIEHAGFAKFTAEDWASDFNVAMLARSAALTADICKRHGIPAVWLTAEDLKAGKRGITGHKQVTDAFSKGVGHWDPGQNFPIGQYLVLVASALT